ncbi:hypothetical protein GDO86_012938 [Hymenochirus boettgeri]|uniref:F-box only protein 2 n=1 Tax=Hymenochirus boettgeri TaxID=247094 RepID=A0A8T2IUR7_9PIPI|nr:hypothetical protein GDO86_012938 [Hymenochirus boettgeri]
MEDFPEAVLIRIFAEVPAEDLILVCRMVCSQWKNLVDGGDVWQMKCQQEGFTTTEFDRNPENWRIIYFLKKRNRNLLKNNCGEEDFLFWEDVQSGGDGWKIEELPGDNGNEFPLEGVNKYFATSFEWCSKSQVIDLLSEGYWEDLLDTYQPTIDVYDWYAARTDAGCLYELCVQLLSDNMDVITEYNSNIITIPQDNDTTWTMFSYSFSEYGPGVRYVRFKHGGQDSVYWKGWYGVRLTNSSVTIEP